MNKLSLKKRLTLFVASILVAITLILTSFTLITVERVMVRPQIDTIGIITFTSSDGLSSNQIGIIRGYEDMRIVADDYGYRGPGHRQRMKNSGYNIDREALDRYAVINNMKDAQTKVSKISIVAMLGIMIFGVLGVYIMIDRALNPLKALSSTIHEIGEDNLNTQLEVPQAEDEIASLIVSFNKMLERLSLMFKEQKNFSAKAAHELKTPLTTMKTSLQVLQMDENPDMEEYEDNLILMENNIDRLIDTVNNLFLLSSDKISLKDRVEVDNLIYSILDSRKEDLEERKISLNLSLGNLVLAANEELLDSCLTNIIDNAIKYNREDSSISIETRKDKDWGRIVVEDRGIGIAKEDLDHIFDAFYRVDETRADGNGLGLSIVKNIVDEHGGRINIESRLGFGTRLELEFPV